LYRLSAAAIIHLGQALPPDSSDLPGNASPSFPEHPAGRRRTLPYLILHHEEFAWPRLLPDAPVSSYLTVSPITAEAAGLFSVALVVARTNVRRPDVIRLAALRCSDFPLLPRQKRLPSPLHYTASASIAKNV